MTRHSKNRWANFNGPGKPITEAQVKEILGSMGVEPHYRMKPDGSVTEFWRREDFEPAFRHFLDRIHN
jgi:hypothetical protein